MIRGLTLAGLFTGLGMAGGFFSVSQNQLLGAVMGGVVGVTGAIIVLAFPRTHDYPHYDDYRRD